MLHGAGGHGLAADQARAAIQDLESIGVLAHIPHGAVVQPTATAMELENQLDTGTADPGASDQASPAGKSKRPLCLLSLFDGLGAARIAIEAALRTAGAPEGLHMAGFAEQGRELGAAVQAYWAERRRLGQGNHCSRS